MTWLDFFSSITSSFAWPLAFLVAILVLKVELSALLPHVRKLKWKEFEAEFEQTLIQARENLDSDQEGGHADLVLGSPATLGSNQYRQLAGVSPRSAILESWRAVELAAYQAARSTSDETPQPRMTSAEIAKLLRDQGLLDGNEDMVFSLLRDLRNKAAHSKDFNLSPQEAVEFTLLARRLQASLEKATETAEQH